MRTADVVKDGIWFGEGPRWHDGELWFSDFYAGAVLSLTPDGATTQRIAIDDQPSGLGWLPDDTLLAVAMKARQVWAFAADGAAPTVYADLGDVIVHMANDMVVCPDGSAYVGGFGFDLDAFMDEYGLAGILGEPGPTLSNIAHIDPTGVVTVAAGDIAFPNGTVLLDGGSTLVVAETLALKLTAFDRDSAGGLSGRRVWADLSGELVAPDGIAAASDGTIWVANAGAPIAVRVAEGGEIVDRVVTSQNCFAVALDDDESALYCCTAPDSHAREVTKGANGRIERAAL